MAVEPNPLAQPLFEGPPGPNNPPILQEPRRDLWHGRETVKIGGGFRWYYLNTYLKNKIEETQGFCNKFKMKISLFAKKTGFVLRYLLKMLLNIVLFVLFVPIQLLLIILSIIFLFVTFKWHLVEISDFIFRNYSAFFNLNILKNRVLEGNNPELFKLSAAKQEALEKYQDFLQDIHDIKIKRELISQYRGYNKEFLTNLLEAIPLQNKIFQNLRQHVFKTLRSYESYDYFKDAEKEIKLARDFIELDKLIENIGLETIDLLKKVLYETPPQINKFLLNWYHFNKIAEVDDIPSAPEDIEIKSLQEIATRNGIDGDEIQTIIKRCKERVHFHMVPKEYDKKEIWYQRFENILKHIIIKLKELEREQKADEIRFEIEQLKEMVGVCGTGWEEVPLEVYKRLNKIESVESSLENDFNLKITAFREGIVNRLTTKYGNNVHAVKMARFQVNRHIRLIGGEFSSPDPLIQDYTFASEFFKQYTYQSLLTHFDEMINGKKPNGSKVPPQLKREKIIKWLRQEIQDENGVTNLFDGPDLKEGAIKYLLFKFGVICQQNPLQTPKKEFLDIDAPEKPLVVAS